PSALDKRPLNFEEWEQRVKQVVYVSATPGPYELAKSQGVVETYTTCLTRCSHSSKFSGRLSSADGSRNPYATSTSFRDRSPKYIPRICGTVWWLSSTTISASSGR